MIFATVGTQLPFDRLVETLDAWAKHHNERQVLIQAGKFAYQPANCKYESYMCQRDWNQYFDNADFVVSHAGMGTILRSLEKGKPLIIMPRLASLNEHRNNHQVATVERFHNYSNIRVVNNNNELLFALDNPPPTAKPMNLQFNNNLNQLITALREFVAQG